jgi:flagellar biosynthesis/type III secretory pathway ATPase
VTLGAYQKGSDARLDLAIKLREKWQGYLRQDREEISSFPLACTELLKLGVAARTPSGVRK